jgi:hypothetical protein
MKKKYKTNYYEKIILSEGLVKNYEIDGFTVLSKESLVYQRILNEELNIPISYKNHGLDFEITVIKKF